MSDVPRNEILLTKGCVAVLYELVAVGINHDGLAHRILDKA